MQIGMIPESLRPALGKVLTMLGMRREGLSVGIMGKTDMHTYLEGAYER